MAFAIATPKITYLPPGPIRHGLAFDLHVGVRPRLPVSARFAADGEVESPSISFDDFSRMQTQRHKLDRGRRDESPAWVLNASTLRSVITRYLELRAGFLKAQPGTDVERIQRAQQKLNSKIPNQDAALTRLCKEYVAFKAPKLAQEIEGLDTALVITQTAASKAAMVAHLYYRLGLNSVEVGKEVGLKPPHIRMLLLRLRKVAASLGYVTPPRVRVGYHKARRLARILAASTPKRQAIVSSPEFIALFEKSLAKMANPKRAHCKNGHLICAQNAHVGDMRRTGRYFCNECQRLYQSAHLTLR